MSLYGVMDCIRRLSASKPCYCCGCANLDEIHQICTVHQEHCAGSYQPLSNCYEEANPMKDFQYQILKVAADLSPKSDKGWVKQLNQVKWGDNPATWDIRSWHYPDGSDTPDKMSKGISLSQDELMSLKAYLSNVD